MLVTPRLFIFSRRLYWYNFFILLLWRITVRDRKWTCIFENQQLPKLCPCRYKNERKIRTFVTEKVPKGKLNFRSRVPNHFGRETLCEIQFIYMYMNEHIYTDTVYIYRDKATEKSNEMVNTPVYMNTWLYHFHIARCLQFGCKGR